VAAPRLDGRIVVVTRGKGGEDALSARLRDLGAEVREIPSIAFAPPADPGPPPGPCGLDTDPPGSPADLGCAAYTSC
jgi:uroporphyrinogen-III synthase